MKNVHNSWALQINYLSIKKLFLSKILTTTKIAIMVPSNFSMQVFYIISGKNFKKWLYVNKSKLQKTRLKKKMKQPLLKGL